MSEPLVLTDIITTNKPDEWAEHLVYCVETMIGTCRIALLNEGIGGELEERRLHMVEQTLEVAQALAHVAGMGCEILQARCRPQVRMEAAE
ncbi:hypothetical protein [Paracoccus litorisediminis]|uniref:Uncharacterized protein n=1 Tax=Paracoccus litorisediminis TaxID=2006130 RepID=A0A844HER4_9RHOB|nr:hypothetical protein [Paracoccus litorisediminis]MTH57870.1 hypothetical protein [Paracoccus litorisediminis]